MIFVNENLVTKDERLEKEIKKEGLKGKINYCNVAKAIPLLQ